MVEDGLQAQQARGTGGGVVGPARQVVVSGLCVGSIGVGLEWGRRL